LTRNLALGSVDISDFYKFFEEKRSIFGDAIFELIDCNQSGSLDFGTQRGVVVVGCDATRRDATRCDVM